MIGLTLTGENAARARAVLAPLRDLFAAAFFLSIGLLVRPAELIAALPAAAALAAGGITTKIFTGWYAARRDGSGMRGRLRAGTALIARGEFSIVVAGAVAANAALAGTVIAYVLILAVTGPLLARYLPTMVGRRRTVEPGAQRLGRGAARRRLHRRRTRLGRLGWLLTAAGRHRGERPDPIVSRTVVSWPGASGNPE